MKKNFVAACVLAMVLATAWAVRYQKILTTSEGVLEYTVTNTVLSTSHDVYWVLGSILVTLPTPGPNTCVVYYVSSESSPVTTNILGEATGSATFKTYQWESSGTPVYIRYGDKIRVENNGDTSVVANVIINFAD